MKQVLEVYANLCPNPEPPDSGLLRVSDEGYRRADIGDEAVVPRSELDRLIEIARQSEEIDLQTDDIPAAGIMDLAQTGGAFDEVTELETEEDSVWAVRARMASEKGLIGEQETREFIERMLNADS